jgi:hypothetical protein
MVIIFKINTFFDINVTPNKYNFINLYIIIICLYLLQYINFLEIKNYLFFYVF